MKTFGGSVLFLDRSDINTDEIIEAKYLEELPKQELETYLFQNLKIEGFNPATDVAGVKVIITRENFGCGSERKNAPWALEVNGINTVVAPTFAKSFRQNMFENGLMAIEIDKKSIADMFRTFADKETECKIVLNDDGTAKVKLIAGSLSKSYQFNVDEAEKALFNK
ncbi:3-isopropylmalate dehydratase small subunit 2 [Treponema sp. Marseille-Q3903]|uniref:3-isopropylmalate dehydratase small subunit n=1 Tax=Treponema sp. Marseille-Q3903 TaxID=2766703 RepID=UPI0016525E7E|nr:3-isopropylmalate dehydratase small subunit [Treponema sp. Marseille-Q3903]MBC6713738.1 3-isopropylmalate dehydratase small subunit [Treponema sp. Marseille-Q3903]